MRTMWPLNPSLVFNITTSIIPHQDIIKAIQPPCVLRRHRLHHTPPTMLHTTACAASNLVNEFEQNVAENLPECSEQALSSLPSLSIDQIAKTIQKASDLSDTFSEDEIHMIARYFTLKSFANDEELISIGQPADALMLVVQGHARVIAGDTQRAVFKEGDFFGENMFSDEGTRNATVQAIGSAKVAIFTLEDHEQLMRHSIKTAIRLRDYFKAVKRERDETSKAQSYVDPTKYLALIAHNDMKESLAEFAKTHVDELKILPLVATGTTGMKLYQDTGLVLSRKVASGPLGGDQAIGTLISTNNVCAVIFFRDPLSAHPHHADIEALGRLCDVYQIPFATNPKTGEAVLKYLQSDHGDQVNLSNKSLENYKTRQMSILA